MKKLLSILLILYTLLLMNQANSAEYLNSPQTLGTEYIIDLNQGDLYMGMLDRASFIYKQKEYSFHIHEIGTTQVRVSIGDIRNIILNLKQTTNLDLDQDSQPDIMVRLEEIKYEKARFYFNEIKQTLAQENPAQETPIIIKEVDNEIPQSPQNTYEEDHTKWIDLSLLIIIILLVVALIISIFKKRKPKKIKKKKTKVLKPKKIKFKKRRH